MKTSLKKLIAKPVDSVSGLGKPLISTTSVMIGRAAGGLGELIDFSSRRSYAAFISYSHRDMKCARWLHRTIENYRVPSGVAGTEGELGKVPAKLRPVFRDEDELPGAAELGPKLEAALAQSRALIVVCSPAAAQSPWVNKEIRTFKRLNPGRPVLPVIAAGTPGSETEECFPEALMWHVTDEGELDFTRPVEPLAPDLQKLERRAVKLKLIAGLLGVPYSALYRRDQRRKRMMTAALGTAAMILIAVLSLLSIAAFTYGNMAVKERNAAVAARQLAIQERNRAVAARDLAERRTWLAQQAASQIRSFAVDCPPG